MSLSARLKTTRKKRGLSQTALANLVQVSQPTVANWERGDHIPRQDALKRIATALGTDPAWLLSGELPADQNPAHQHLAKPLHHIPVYEWPQNAASPIAGQPARYITIAMDATGVFALDANVASGFPDGTVLLFHRFDDRPAGQFLILEDGTFKLKTSKDLLDNVFARLIYSIVPH